MNSNNISSINQIKKSNADNLGYLSKKVILFMVLMVNTIELYWVKFKVYCKCFCVSKINWNFFYFFRTPLSFITTFFDKILI